MSDAETTPGVPVLGVPAPNAGADVPRWPCWVGAGVSFVAAGYLATTAGTWQHYARLLEAEVSGPALLILRAPHGAPLALLLVGLLVLAVALRREVPRALLLAAPVAATLLACALCTSHVVLFRHLQLAMQGG